MPKRNLFFFFLSGRCFLRRARHWECECRGSSWKKKWHRAGGWEAVAGQMGLLCWEATGRTNEPVLVQKHHRCGCSRLAGAVGSWNCLSAHPPVCSGPDKHRVTQGTRRPMSQCYNETCGIIKLHPSPGEWQAFLEQPFSLTKGALVEK